MLGSIGAVSYDIVSQDKTAEGLTSAGDRARQIGKVAGAAMTGIGVAMIALTDSAKKTNATIRQTALQLGVTAEEMRELTLRTTNVTFPIKEVTASFDLLTRAGMENKEEIAITATAFDTLGDAIGMNASQVTAIMIPAFDAFQIELKDASKYTDIFTHLSRNTTVELSDFSSMLNYLAADLGTMDLEMIDSVAILEALADKGIKGSAATREFRTAVNGAEGDVGKLYEALGLTEAEVAKYSKEIKNSTGITDKFAKAANTQYGTMDKIKQSISTLTLKYGSMLEPLDALGPAMATLGPIMIMMSSIQWGTLIPALTAHAAAAWASIAPYLLIIAPIVAVIAILYILEKKFGLVTKALKILKDIAGKVMGFFKKLRDTFLGIKDVTEDMTDASNKLGKAEAKLIELEEDLTDARKAEERATRDVEDATKKLEDAQKAVAATAEEIDELTTAYEDLLDIEKDVLDITEDIDDQHRAVEHAMWDLKDAQDDYNDAVAEYAAHSDEAAKANLRLRDAQDRYDDSLKRVEDSEQKLIDKNNEKTDVLKENNATSLQDLEDTLEAKQEAAEPAFENIRNLELDLEGKVEIQKQREVDVAHLEGALDDKKKDIEDYTGEVERIEEESGKTRLNMAERLYGGIKELADVAYSKVLSILDRFGDKLLFLLGPIGAVIYAFRNWREILGTIKDTFNSVISYIGSLYSTFTNMGRNLILNLINGVKEKIGDVKNTISDALSSAGSSISDKNRTFRDKGRNLIVNLINGINEKTGNLRNILSTTLNSMSNSISDKYRTFRERGGILIQNLIDGMCGKLGSLKTTIGIQLNSVVSYIKRWYNTFYGIGVNLIRYMINGVIVNLWALKTTIGIQLNSVVSYVKRWYGTFYGMGRNLILYMTNGIIWTLWSLKNQIGTQLNSIVQYIKRWYNTFYYMGRNLIQSLINGVVEKIWALKNKINDLLWWIYNRLPHSPVKEGPLVEEPDWESYLIEPMRTAKISPSVMFESGMGGGVGASVPPIEVIVEATIYNYSDVEGIERTIGEAVSKGIHDAYGMR